MAYHTRSNSFPSTKHPFTSQLDEQFSRLKSSQTSTSSSSICNQLNCLQDLHDCVEKCLLLPLSTQQSLSHQENPIDQILDGSLKFLDVCNMAKDALLETKECVHQLQSMMRRKRGGELSISSEIKEYFTCRKMVKKAVHKALNNLKVTETKDHRNVPIITMLKEVEGVTINVLESVLSLINGSNKTQVKLSGWSLVSKLVHHKRLHKEDLNEFERLDVSLQSPKINVENLQNQLKDVELCIQDFEDGIEGLYRRLIRTRVSLLNTLVH